MRSSKRGKKKKLHSLIEESRDSEQRRAGRVILEFICGEAHRPVLGARTETRTEHRLVRCCVEPQLIGLQDPFGGANPELFGWGGFSGL